LAIHREGPNFKRQLLSTLLQQNIWFFQQNPIHISHIIQLRPPQPPIYFFIFDVSSNAIDSGYLHTFSEQLLMDLDKLPGNDRALIGFLGFDSALHFFYFHDPESEPKHIIEFDIEGLSIKRLKRIILIYLQKVFHLFIRVYLFHSIFIEMYTKHKSFIKIKLIFRPYEVLFNEYRPYLSTLLLPQIVLVLHWQSLRTLLYVS
jgi:hypothetical protein